MVRFLRSLGLRQSSQSGGSSDAGLVDPTQLIDLPTAYAWEDSTQAERIALRQMQAIDAARAQHLGRGTLRTAAPGTTFTLADHPDHDGSDSARDRFVVPPAARR